MIESWKYIQSHPIKENTMKVSSHGRFMNSSGEICDEYQSTNGFKYILLPLNDEEYKRTGKQYRLFPSDDVVAITFVEIPEYLLDDPYKQIIHKDGDTLNNHAENLKWISGEYRWEIIDLPDIRKQYYQVSDRGEIRRICDMACLQPIITRDGYNRPSLMSTVAGCHNRHNVHRIVAYYFVKGRTPDREVVNHIDGNRSNNYWKNLEWVTTQENIQHASMTLSLPIGENNANSIITNNDAIKICESLNRHNGAIIDVYNELISEIPSLTYPVVSSIKYGITFNHVSNQYLNENGKNKQTRHDDYETVIEIAKCLKRNKGNVKKTRDEMISVYPWISLGYIWHLKDKSVSADITDMVFSKDEFPKCLTMNEDIAEDIVKSLMQHKGAKNISHVVYEEMKDKYPGLTKDHVRYIKDKRTFTQVSDRYFQKGDLD